MPVSSAPRTAKPVPGTGTYPVAAGCCRALRGSGTPPGGAVPAVPVEGDAEGAAVGADRRDSWEVGCSVTRGIPSVRGWRLRAAFPARRSGGRA
ncbi:hypothetical protein GCM10010211_49470 [Streptomyces albospinus]|uniref:Uncharacterized protein n=1 Tax=Streptomyces albospinus TaxID=285515 RepID=A0ABQ2VDF1_9ACTN|nr:hypothetical protein GCM10010211_49470 [Streptomyces albospinus]